ncbi:Uncharacterised protein [Bordetella pertussis]|nr:Uncharacterised protein [Bordetella pertussis]CFW29241.1 Uncharacterised protein [Bordetella pertussis]
MRPSTSAGMTTWRLACSVPMPASVTGSGPSAAGAAATLTGAIVQAGAEPASRRYSHAPPAIATAATMPAASVPFLLFMTQPNYQRIFLDN